MKSHRSPVILTALGLVLALGALAFFRAQNRLQTTAPLPAVVRGEPINPASSTTPAPVMASSASTENAVKAPATKRPGFLPVGFDLLATAPVEVDPITGATKITGAFPASIQALHEKGVSVEGYMLPLKGDAGLITEFLLLKDQTQCCFGGPQNLSECVEVRMAGKGVVAAIDIPVTVLGKFRVGEIRDNGYLSGIYRMDGEQLVVPTE